MPKSLWRGQLRFEGCWDLQRLHVQCDYESGNTNSLYLRYMHRTSNKGTFYKEVTQFSRRTSDGNAHLDPKLSWACQSFMLSIHHCCADIDIHIARYRCKTAHSFVPNSLLVPRGIPNQVSGRQKSHVTDPADLNPNASKATCISSLPRSSLHL